MAWHLHPYHKTSQTAVWILAGTLLLACGCQDTGPQAHLRTQSGTELAIDVEVARTPAQRNMGLMFRKILPRQKGMLFIFESDQQQAFTMKNTFIPLDMIFIDRSNKIVGLVENARPLTSGPYKVDAPSRYVLEVNASFCRQHGLSVGDTVEWRNMRLQ
jgi:hypothetical protein